MERKPLADIFSFEFPSYCKPPFVSSRSPKLVAGTIGAGLRSTRPATSCRLSLVRAMIVPARSTPVTLLGALYRQIVDFSLYGFDQAAIARRQLGRWVDDLGLYFRAEMAADRRRLAGSAN